MLSSRRFFITGILAIVLLLSFYIYQIQAYTQASFVIADYESQIKEISTSQGYFALNFSKDNSPTDLEKLLNSTDFHEVGLVRYIQMTSAQVAVK